MEYPIFPTQKKILNGPKVIRVVNLKRFMPEASLASIHQSKRRRNSPVENLKSNIVNGSQNNINSDHVQNSMFGIDNDLENQRTIDKSSGKQSYIDYTNSQLLSVNGSKIKFRKCSHSDEELSKLHECVDDTLVKVGDTFESRDAFKQYLNDNAKRWHYYYVCRNSKEKLIEYNCICMAYNTKERVVVIRKQKKRTTACPCKIRLTIANSDQLIVYYVCNHHDHPTTAGAFHHYPHAKYLPQHVKEEFLDLTYLGLHVDLIQKYVQSTVGLTVKKKDIWSYAYRFKRKIFKRSISEERRKYMEGLMTNIRETYGELDTKQQELPSEHSEVVLSIKEVELRESESTKYEKREPIPETLTARDDLTLNYSEDLIKVLGDASIDTEVIVQYINEEGILCDENGAPITNSSDIMRFINNYAYLPQDSDPTALSELDIGEQVDPFDWEPSTVVHESQPGAMETEAVLNDVAELDGAVGTESLESVEAVETDSYENRLSPTPVTPAVYANMENFRKYYYTDHRYIPYEHDKIKEGRAPQDVAVRYSVTDSSALAREEFIKAPDFVYHPSPIRHCSGHDQLVLLTDAGAIHPGAKFLTHDVFLTYINERANRWFFYYSMMESGKTPEYYVYKCVFGKTRVSKNAYRARGLRKRNKLTTQCPCQIRLRRLEAEPAYLTVLYSCNHHDHALDARQFHAQPHTRRLPALIKEEIKDLITLGVGAEVLRKHVFAETGVRVYGKYFHNVRAGMRARGEQRQYSEQRLRALTRKIRDLESIYGNAAKETPQSNLARHQPKQRVLPPLPIRTEDRFTQADFEESGTQTQEYCELSDKDDFAQEVCILQADTLPMEDAAKQSRLETRLQNLSHKEILSKVKKLQDSVRCDGASDERVMGLEDYDHIG